MPFCRVSSTTRPLKPTTLVAPTSPRWQDHRPWHWIACSQVVTTAATSSPIFVGLSQLEGLFAFTTHSPYQLSYGAIRAFGAYDFTAVTNEPNPYLAAKMQRDLAQAKIIVATAADTPSEIAKALAGPPPDSPSANSHGSIITMDALPDLLLMRIPSLIATAMRDHFTIDPPPCAQGFVPIAGLEIFFRKS